MGASVVDAEPIERERLRGALGNAAAGAVVTFEGCVRDHDRGRAVVGLRYEAHPAAGSVLAALVDEAEQHAGVLGVAAAHRLGHLAPGDLAFLVIVSAPHRGEAFATCQWLVEEAKRRLPIWKHQTFADGSSEWVNCL